MYWNDYRRRWVMIFVELNGTSFLGEVWFAEADTPLGPWVFARKIVTHDRQTFYNPKQHPFFDKDNGRILFFEGTYTNSFSGNSETTPRYEYNQILYKLDLADLRLNLPVAIYACSGEKPPARFGTASQLTKSQSALPPAFFALDRPGKGTARSLPAPWKRCKLPRRERATPRRSNAACRPTFDNRSPARFLNFGQHNHYPERLLEMISRCFLFDAVRCLVRLTQRFCYVCVRNYAGCHDAAWGAKIARGCSAGRLPGPPPPRPTAASRRLALRQTSSWSCLPSPTKTG